LPCVRAQGGPDPEALFAAHPLAEGADPDAVTVTLAALAGYLVRQSRQPPPPGLPTLRAFQGAQGVAALDWLRTRLGPALP
ncbi:aminoglycoside phosphotransferase family protein, partial [Streptomyces sp. T-3]|nr:aminoglycoside phosphotransferase family protein [Streptomyces sp. T-3]